MKTDFEYAQLFYKQVKINPSYFTTFVRYATEVGRCIAEGKPCYFNYIEPSNKLKEFLDLIDGNGFEVKYFEEDKVVSIRVIN